MNESSSRAELIFSGALCLATAAHLITQTTPFPVTAPYASLVARPDRDPHGVRDFFSGDIAVPGNKLAPLQVEKFAGLEVVVSSRGHELAIDGLSARHLLRAIAPEATNE